MYNSFACIRTKMDLEYISSVNFSMYSAGFNRRTFFYHLLFWVLYVAFNAYLWQTFDKNYNHTTLFGMTRLPIKIMAVYINYLLLVQFFFKKKYISFLFFFVLNLLLAG